MPYSGNGYIIQKYRGAKEIYEYLWGLTEQLNFKSPQDRKKYHHFIVHVYANMKFNYTKTKKIDYDEADFVPIYSRLLENCFGRGFNPKKLEDIIKIKPHNHQGHKSRRFRLKEKVFKKAIQIEKKFVFEHWGLLSKGDRKAPSVTTVNLITGRKTNNPLKSELRHGDDRNIPQHIKDSIRTLEPCPINPHQAEKYLRGFYKKYIKEKKDFKAIKKTYGDKHKIYNQAERSYKKAFGRYLNIQTALETILFQQPKRIPLKSTQGERLYSYQSAYTIQNSGRLTELRGGFQSSPRILKHALTSNIKNLYNYDLVNSQANLLIEEFKKCGIKCQWLENYISKPNMKKIYAKRVGIPVEIWKNCFYALLMGAEPENKWGDIYNTIKNEAENEKEAEKQHKRFLKVIHDLTEATDVWRDYIYETTNRRHFYRHDGKTFWKNACNMHYKEFHKEGPEPKSENKRTGMKARKRKIAAFILQGLEANLIHNLTSICSEDNIPVYKNEHDGLIMGKRIDGRALDKAIKRSRIAANLYLERKPICSKEKIREMKSYVKS